VEAKKAISKNAKAIQIEKINLISEIKRPE
jgi:hypothetical protein